MRLRSVLIGVLFVAAAGVPGFAAGPARGLDVYFIDTEGGAATLLVTPAGESVLIDCGNPGSRDADRIHKIATEKAHLKAIDHLVISHWHTDHYGGVARLARLIPIKNFYDHGIPEKLREDPKNFPLLIQAYKEASGGKSRTLKPGDEVALKQTEGAPALRMRCLCAAGQVLPEPPGAPENPIAREHKPKAEDTSDNARSLGFLITFGGFRFLNLGDLTWNIEHKLVSPSDKIGRVDLYQAVHHGLDISNNPVLIRTVQPRVAIFGNGPRKGAAPSVIATLRRLPEPPAIYQVHRNITSGAAENTDPEFIANPGEKCQAELIKVAVAADGKSYTVLVARKEKGKTYAVRASK
jgi:beta-lactamase superfamily II metal-dependent hydrolase